MEQDFLKKVVTLYRQLRREIGDTLQQDDVRRVKQLLTHAASLGHIQSDDFGLNPILMSLETARLAVSEIGVRRDSVIAIMLMPIAPYLSEDLRTYLMISSVVIFSVETPRRAAFISCPE